MQTHENITTYSMWPYGHQIGDLCCKFRHQKKILITLVTKMIATLGVGVRNLSDEF